jgi:hypothetical protein
MHHGSEDMTAQRWNEKEIVHFDLKPANSTNSERFDGHQMLSTLVEF